jgi:hypothetical protein
VVYRVTVGIKAVNTTDRLGWFFKEIVLNKEVFLFSKKFSLFVGPNQLPIHWVSGTFSSEAKQPELESDHSHPPRTRRKIGGGVFMLSMACLATTLPLYYPYDSLF